MYETIHSGRYTADMNMRIEEKSGEIKQVMETLFHQTDAAWVVEQIIPLLTALIAVGVAYMGFKHALKRQAKDYQHQFQIRTYEQILDPINEALDESGTYMALLNGFSSQISLNHTAQQKDYSPTDLKRRPEDYIQKHHEYLKSLGLLMKSLESILIIEPKLKIFITALSSIHWDISECRTQISQATYSYLTKDLITIDGTEIKVPPEPITLEEKDSIQKIIGDMNEIMIDGTCYIMDLKIELQNILLGEVYHGKKLPHREPVDPKKIVISIENYDALKRNFKENHAIGQEQERLERTIKEQIKNAD